MDRLCRGGEIVTVAPPCHHHGEEIQDTSGRHAYCGVAVKMRRGSVDPAAWSERRKEPRLPIWSEQGCHQSSAVRHTVARTPPWL